MRNSENASLSECRCLSRRGSVGYGDGAFIAKALGDIARAKGMTQIARDAGLSRESLYKSLSGERNPGLDTILKVIAALGLKLHAEPVDVDLGLGRP